jgi:hypothetical protein
MGSLKEIIRQLKEKLVDLGSYKVFTIAMGSVLLPTILEWFGFRLIAVFLVGLYVVAGMILLYNTIR